MTRLSDEVIEARIWCHIAEIRLAAALTMAGDRNRYSNAPSVPRTVTRERVPPPPWPKPRAMPLGPGQAAAGAPAVTADARKGNKGRHT